MSNSRYLYYMDFIRFEIMFRSKLYEHTAKKGIYPILGSQKIIYKKPLKRWSRFTITLILEGWDDKWVYHKQIFVQNEKYAPLALPKRPFGDTKKYRTYRKFLKIVGSSKPK